MSWFEIQNPINEESISKQTIWNNTNIKVGNKTIFNKIYHNRGIQFIEHLYDYRIHAFYNFKDSIELYDLPKHSFLLYRSVISSIPNDWKTKLKSEVPNIHRQETLLSRILKSKQTNKFLYEYQLRKDGKISSKPEQKWELFFADKQFDWKNIYMMPFKSTIDTKLREFQYKYIMRIIPTNKFLFKCNLVQSNLCDFCNSYIETL